MAESERNEDSRARSRVDELSDVLYSRTRYKDPVTSRKGLRSGEEDLGQEEWQSPDLDEMLKHEREVPESHPIMKKIFISSIIFFIIAVLVAGYAIFGGANFISSKNVDITILGPVSVSAGEPIELGITIVNRNNADLEQTNLSIQFPEGSRDPLDTSKILNFTKKTLGEIGAGREAVETVGAVIFGSTGDMKEIKVSIEYKVKGSNATFYKEKIFEIFIGETPLTFSAVTPRSVDSGEIFLTTITVVSKSTEILRGVRVRAEYPYGFTAGDITPQAIVENNVWSLGDLSPGERKTITIRGRLVGENGDERTFRFYTGVADPNDNNPNFRTIISSLQNTVSIDKPSVSLSVFLGGDDSTLFIAPLGRPINGSVRFQNNLPEKLINPRLEVRFSGTALDKASVRSPDGGFYDSSNNRIVWEPKNALGVAELIPGDIGRANFSFSSLPTLSSSLSGREIKLEIILTGVPLGGSSQRSITITETRSVRIASEINLSSRSLYSRGPLTNKGPIPPKADTETTYTIVWTVANTQAEITNAEVRANLGQNVIWLGSGTSAEDVSYDENSNTIVWRLGTLASGVGFSSPSREIAFQVSITPSISQIGSIPTLTSGAVFTGLDTFTGDSMRVTNQSLTTRISSDPAFVQGDEYVVK